METERSQPMALIHLQPGDVIVIDRGLALTVAAVEELVAEGDKEPDPTKEDLLDRLGQTTLNAAAWPSEAK
jgi:hypothetical protein